MKPQFYIVILIVFIVGAFIYQASSKRATKSETGSSILSDISFLLEKLNDINNSYAFLILEDSKDSTNFIQMQINNGEIQFSFPLITSKQQSLENSIRSFVDSFELSLEEHIGSDGSIFLDITTSGTLDEYKDIIISLFKNIYKLESNVSVNYIYDPGN